MMWADCQLTLRKCSLDRRRAVRNSTDASIQQPQESKPRTSVTRPRNRGVKAMDLDFGLEDQGQGLTSLERSAPCLCPRGPQHTFTLPLYLHMNTPCSVNIKTDICVVIISACKCCSLSLYLGNEIFDVHVMQLQGDFNHLFVRQGTGLQGQSVFKTKLTFRFVAIFWFEPLSTIYVQLSIFMMSLNPNRPL